MKLAQQLVVENLPRYLNNARSSRHKPCREFAARFDALFRLEEIYGLLKLSPVYLKKINQWLHGDQRLIEQIRKQVRPKCPTEADEPVPLGLVDHQDLQSLYARRDAVQLHAQSTTAGAEWTIARKLVRSSFEENE